MSCKCPYCGSENTRKTVGTYAAYVGKGATQVLATLADGATIAGAYVASAPLFAPAAALGNFGQKICEKIHKKMSKVVDPKIREQAKKITITDSFVCSDCGKTW